MLLGKLLLRWKLLTLCVLFATCGGGLVKSKEPAMATEAPPDDANLTCVSSEPEQVVLERHEYKIQPDGTLFVSRLKHFVNASSYAVSGDLAMVCLPQPECEHRIRFMRPLYFSALAVFLHLHVPTLVCGTRSFNRWCPLFYILFFYFMTISLITAPVCHTPQYPGGEFLSLWYNLPSYLSVVGVHVAGALAALHSNVAMSQLVPSRDIFVKRGSIFVAKREIIAAITAIFGVLIFTFTYIIVLFEALEPLQDFVVLRNHLPYFMPSCMMYFIVNMLFSDFLDLTTPPELTTPAWRKVRDKRLPYFMFFVAAFVNYTFGFVVTMNDWWDMWSPFVVISVLHPIALCGYIHNNSRRVIYADQKCVKILEVDGEVVTIRFDPPKGQEKTGTDWEKQPDSEEWELAWIVLSDPKHPPKKQEKTGTDKEKSLKTKNWGWLW